MEKIKKAKLQSLKDIDLEREEAFITLISELREEKDDYRDIDKEKINYFIIISKEVVDEKQIKGLLEEETEYKRKYREYDYSINKHTTKHHKLKKIGKNKFGFSQEATDDNGEFIYTYSLVESRVISYCAIHLFLKPSFLFHLDTPKLYSISDDSYRKLFFDPSRVGKQVIPIINGIGRDELNHLFIWLEKELKF